MLNNQNESKNDSIDSEDEREKIRNNSIQQEEEFALKEQEWEEEEQDLLDRISQLELIKKRSKEKKQEQEHADHSDLIVESERRWMNGEGYDELIDDSLLDGQQHTIENDKESDDEKWQEDVIDIIEDNEMDNKKEQENNFNSQDKEGQKQDQTKKNDKLIDNQQQNSNRKDENEAKQDPPTSDSILSMNSDIIKALKQGLTELQKTELSQSEFSKKIDHRLIQITKYIRKHTQKDDKGKEQEEQKEIENSNNNSNKDKPDQ
ncbi:MAG: hypothetical protein EZS28_049158 [Streblomastix strix]|uniref:Uncharacterized protein n=1 Tax=Streblomastix strix TaxID=222440 RepID=A0A5J4TCU5_9EUKA|nr:MAG: hypothetical protein EZS28_049158 [Streblomastix strix]